MRRLSVQGPTGGKEKTATSQRQPNSGHVSTCLDLSCLSVLLPSSYTCLLPTVLILIPSTKTNTYLDTPSSLTHSHSLPP